MEAKYPHQKNKWQPHPKGCGLSQPFIFRMLREILTFARQMSAT